MEELKTGCLWVVGTSTKGFGAKKTTHKVFCNKMRNTNSIYCPKHLLMEDERVRLNAEFPARMKRARVVKRERLEALAASPLAAFNPRFDKPKEHGGMDAEETK